MGRAAPVVMIGLDAAEISLIERGCAEGKLPALASLRRQGCFGRLEADATIFAGAVWPTFYTGTRLPWHGIYHDQLWRQEKMRFEIVHDRWRSPTPFWELLGRDYRVAIVDVPLVLRMPPAMNGVMVSGWGTHDRVFAGTRPHRLHADLVRACGAPVLDVPFVRPRTVAQFCAARDNLIATTEQLAGLCTFLLAREAWDVFCVVFGAPHRGGHHLWDLSQLDPGESVAARAQLTGALEAVYAACDRAVAEVIEASPPGARILVFAAHGMGPNPGWNDRFDQLLSATRRTVDTATPEMRPPARSALRRRLGQAVSDLSPAWIAEYIANRRLTSSRDWHATRYFPLAMDHAGYVRINLAGREARGIVPPGPEYRELCAEITAAVSELRDIETDEPIVRRVYHVDELAPADAPHRDMLPDLVITWGERSAIDSRGVYRPGHGESRWSAHEPLVSLRSGNHRDHGWFVAVGDNIAGGSRADGHHLADLAPTLFDWIGADGRGAFQGTPITALCGHRRTDALVVA